MNILNRNYASSARQAGDYALIREEYIGQTNYQGQRHGKGRYVFRKGDLYEGEWKNNKMHGSGKFKCLNGVKYKGTFAEGKPVNVLRYEKGRKERRLTQDEHRKLCKKLKRRLYGGVFRRVLRSIQNFFQL